MNTLFTLQNLYDLCGQVFYYPLIDNSSEMVKIMKEKSKTIIFFCC